MANLLKRGFLDTLNVGCRGEKFYPYDRPVRDGMCSVVCFANVSFIFIQLLTAAGTVCEMEKIDEKISGEIKKSPKR
jgi:hypothetical protein